MPIGGTAFLGQNQSPRLTTNYLNQASRRGDPAPGVPVSTAQVSGSIVQPYYGFAGGKLTITNPWATQFADPSVGPLYGGVVQYVQFSPNMVTPATRGAVCFWLNEPNYVVTTDYAAGTSFKPAGVIINPDAAGNWDFIYIGGIAMALFGGAAALGSMVVSQTATPPTPSGVVSGTTLSPLVLGTVVLSAGVSAQVSPVELNLLAGWNQ